MPESPAFCPFMGSIFLPYCHILVSVLSNFFQNVKKSERLSLQDLQIILIILFQQLGRIQPVRTLAPAFSTVQTLFNSMHLLLHLWCQLGLRGSSADHQAHPGHIVDLDPHRAGHTIAAAPAKIPQQFLPLCAGLAVKSGMDEFEALKSITIHAAKHIGVAKRVGSLEIGKDADFVIASGNPMVSDTKIQYVLIDGNITFEA